MIVSLSTAISWIMQGLSSFNKDLKEPVRF